MYLCDTTNKCVPSIFSINRLNRIDYGKQGQEQQRQQSTVNTCIQKRICNKPCAYQHANEETIER